MRTPMSRQRVFAGAVATLALAALAACGSNDPGGATPGATTPNGDSYIGGAPSGSRSASPATGNTGGNTGGTTGGNTVTYPKDAKSYGLAFLQALAQGDRNRLNLFAVQSAVAQVTDGFYDHLNAQWTYRGCGPDENDPANTTKTKCVYDNADGDEIKIGMNKTQLGAPTAVLEALLEKTTYPDDPGQYATEMLSAFELGNNNRVVRLSNSTVKGKLSCKLESHMTTVTPIDATYSSVEVTDGNAGHSYTLKVLTKPGGKAGAIKDITAKQC